MATPACNESPPARAAPERPVDTQRDLLDERLQLLRARLAQNPEHRPIGAIGQIRAVQEPQCIWQRQHPLTQRTLGQDLVGQQRRGLGHAPYATRGAEAALLAAERHQRLGVAVVTMQTQEALFQAPALQVGVELLLDVIRQRPAGLGAQLTKRGILLLDEPIQQRGVGPVASIARRKVRSRNLAGPRRPGRPGPEGSPGVSFRQCAPSSPAPFASAIDIARPA